MPRSSRKQIDEDEKKVIYELQKNSKESIDKIAKKCGFSRQKVWRIIKRLEKNKTIWGYHAIIDDEKLKQKSYLVLIKKTNEPVSTAAEKILSRDIEQEAKKIGVTITESEYLHGVYDWTFCFKADNIKHAKKFCEMFNRIYHTHVSELHLLEKIFPIKRCNVHNPEMEKLREFV
jgi:DNA-binding Lrp family transcriptional regulator